MKTNNATVIKNKLPGLLKARGMSATDLGRVAFLSYPVALELSKASVIADEKQVGNFRKICEALQVEIDDVLEFVTTD
jgi:DNA-binding Xre family transcriptional regulator